MDKLYKIGGVYALVNQNDGTVCGVYKSEEDADLRVNAFTILRKSEYSGVKEHPWKGKAGRLLYSSFKAGYFHGFYGVESPDGKLYRRVRNG